MIFCPCEPSGLPVQVPQLNCFRHLKKLKCWNAAALAVGCVGTGLGQCHPPGAKGFGVLDAFPSSGMLWEMCGESPSKGDPLLVQTSRPWRWNFGSNPPPQEVFLGSCHSSPRPQRCPGPSGVSFNQFWFCWDVMGF